MPSILYVDAMRFLIIHDGVLNNQSRPLCPKIIVVFTMQFPPLAALTIRMALMYGCMARAAIIMYLTPLWTQ